MPVRPCKLDKMGLYSLYSEALATPSARPRLFITSICSTATTLKWDIMKEGINFKREGTQLILSVRAANQFASRARVPLTAR